MILLFAVFGAIIGLGLTKPIKNISLKIVFEENLEKEFKLPKILIIIISMLVCIISYLIFGLSAMFFKAEVLNCLLIVISFIDLKHQLIPNYLVFLTLCAGLLLTSIGEVSIVASLLGMLVGGGLVFILALVPSSLGGGDIKLMFALGSFLGPYRVTESLFLAFVFAAIVSSALLLFKIKGRKDYIPLGPFLAIGAFVSFHILFLS